MIDYLYVKKKKSFFVLLPDRTVYDMESGSYFDPYNSFTQTRAPVVLMYCKIRQTHMKYCMPFLFVPSISPTLYLRNMCDFNLEIYDRS